MDELSRDDFRAFVEQVTKYNAKPLLASRTLTRMIDEQVKAYNALPWIYLSRWRRLRRAWRARGLRGRWRTWRIRRVKDLSKLGRAYAGYGISYHYGGRRHDG